MHFSLAQSLAVALPLTAALAQAEPPAKRDLNAVVSDVKDFFGVGGPVSVASNMPRCAAGCLRVVAAALKCKPLDLECQCGKDEGKAWQDKVRSCNKDAPEKSRCDGDAIQDAELVELCHGLAESSDKLNETVQAFARVFDDDSESDSDSDEESDDDDNDDGAGGSTAGGEKSGAAGAGAVGKAAVAAFAAVLGFAVALL